jgi:hypothetical protein
VVAVGLGAAEAIGAAEIATAAAVAPNNGVMYLNLICMVTLLWGKNHVALLDWLSRLPLSLLLTPVFGSSQQEFAYSG